MTHDGKPMIENSDRGITVAKPLAWSMLGSIVAAVWFGAWTISGLTSSIKEVDNTLARMQSENTLMRGENTQVEGRVRALENNASRQDARFDGLKQSLDEVKEQGRETNALLRQIMQGKAK